MSFTIVNCFQHPKCEIRENSKTPICNQWEIEKREGLDDPIVFQTDNLTCKYGLMQEIMNHCMGEISLM